MECINAIPEISFLPLFIFKAKKSFATVKSSSFENKVDSTDHANSGIKKIPTERFTHEKDAERHKY